MLLWLVGFSLLWAAGTFAEAQFIWSMVGLSILSIASVAYKPFSVAIVSDLAPASLRGVYMAVSSQSWTIGYFLGPICGGWAMDQSSTVARLFWLAVALSTFVCIGLLWLFEVLHPDATVTDANPHPSGSGTSA
jgi:MFS family permease